MGRDTEAPVSPAVADRAAEGSLPRARAQSKEDLAPGDPGIGRTMGHWLSLASPSQSWHLLQVPHSLELPPCKL